MSGLLEELDNTNFQFYPSESLHQIPVDESSCLENGTIVNNEPSVANFKQSPDNSLVVDKPEIGEQVTQKVASMDKKRKIRDGSSLSPAQAKGKKKQIRKCNGVMKNGDDDGENKRKDNKKDENKVLEEAPTGYIHVRARRAKQQTATALQRGSKRRRSAFVVQILYKKVVNVRREKISERMKLLQGLVPGCDKFLSLKLASANPMLYDFGMDLDSLMVAPDEIRLNGLASPILLPEVPNSFPILGTTSSFLFQQGQRSNILSQDNGQLLWDVDGQRQKLVDQSGFTNNLCSFH
ncbi:basic helix-loop-helix (bHLH) DNA-binding superfamily protein [Actinidia rufa]|uniref:Basic helix-loop-helix (BHLH) DNA-binding superfamily protein n=1 Tax=Actinidia rufa TaxID=165716 RepID=A0A7J0FZE0_9ERIC|nr:basic helix-loop-helix (bHLH) DNA-binding superfamily protein [Actinidia rufa]